MDSGRQGNPDVLREEPLSAEWCLAYPLSTGSCVANQKVRGPALWRTALPTICLMRDQSQSFAEGHMLIQIQPQPPPVLTARELCYPLLRSV